MSNVSGLCQDCISLLTPPPNHKSTHSLCAAQFLLCNDPPLDSELAAFKHDVAGWESIVADLQQRIARVQTFLDSLVEARTDAEARLNDAKALLRPICRMPNEILTDIFHLCIPAFPDHSKDYDCLNMTTVPWTLTHVCRRWRNLARSLPSLWSYVKVDSARHRQISMFPVKAFLELSRDVPLSVHVTSKAALEGLRGSEHRWKLLRAHLTQDDYGQLENISFPALETLRHSRIKASTISSLDIFNAHTAPNLRVLTGNYTVLEHLQLPWTHLTDLMLFGEFGARLVPFVERMTNLNRVHLLAPSAEFNVPLMLPRVTDLCITEHVSAPTGSLKNVLEHTMLPMLSTLWLIFDNDPRVPRDTCFPTMLNSTFHLTTLEIDLKMSKPVQNAERLLDFLSLTPQVKDFKIRNSTLTEAFVLGLACVAGEACRLPAMSSLDIGWNGAVKKALWAHGNPTEVICRMLESRMARGAEVNACQPLVAVLEEVILPRWMYHGAKIWSSARWTALREEMKLFCAVDCYDID